MNPTKVTVSITRSFKQYEPIKLELEYHLNEDIEVAMCDILDDFEGAFNQIKQEYYPQAIADEKSKEKPDKKEAPPVKEEKKTEKKVAKKKKVTKKVKPTVKNIDGDDLEALEQLMSDRVMEISEREKKQEEVMKYNDKEWEDYVYSWANNILERPLGKRGFTEEEAQKIREFIGKSL